MSDNALIKAEHLTHIYSQGTPFEHIALNDVCFEIEKGDFIGVIGHTGSGKSTLMQHLNGLMKPTSGKLYFNGRDVWEKGYSLKDLRFSVGVVFQYPEYQLFEETVRKDVAFGPKNMGLSEDETEKRVIDAIRFVGLDESVLEKSPFDLSYSHHAHQEIVQGVATEMSGGTLAKMTLMHWCETVLFLMWVGMFFVWDNPVSWVVALVVMAATYFVEVLIDNTFARSTWRSCFKLGWGVALVFGLLNLMPILVDVFI